MLNPSPSPSPSPMSGRPNLVARPLSSANRTPSIEISAAVPMLTSLSLPASPDTSMSLDLDPIISRSPRLSPIDGDASPWSLSLSPASPVLSIVPDLSLSSPAAGNTVDGHVVSFPSPSSSSSPFVSPLPSPLLDSITEAEYVGDTSAAEYAAAIMSSAWASEGPSLTQAMPPAVRSTEENETASPVFSNADVDQPALASEEEELSQPLAYQENVPLRRQEAKVSGVIGKMKKFSDKFKRLLRGKAKISRDNGGVNIDVNVRRAGSSPLLDALPDVIDIQSHTSVAQAYDSLLSNNDTDTRLPLPLPPPPGLVLRKSKTRPILSSQTYNSTLTRSRTNDNPARQITPVIRIRPPSSLSNIAISNNDNNPGPKTPSPDLTVHARPKTLAEIKSKRRLSLSALSNFTRSPSPVPPVNIVTSNRHGARPASALAFYPRPPTLSSVRSVAQVERAATPQRLQVPRSASSREISTAFPGTVRSNSTRAHPSMVPLPLPQPTAETIKKKNRRFSLSALSNFAAGEGSWQRNGGLSLTQDA
ncbi:hypothetical protein B0H16DRAFT_1490241 [Mycena metata]|uniref:Uncharacterized protein n=1 Tax=Mycena metata TaxID=1033252 RepID=A0AAD7KJK8_9AGAR|nr:hypothetical protein B0H16DRAFT_1490241 [Mycena metata]